MLNKLLEVLFKRKPEEIAVSVEKDGFGLWIKLAANNQLRARMDCVIESDTTILIGDIRHYKENSHYNRGYGSLMMEELLGYAKENGFSYIHGNLAQVDLDHKERLHHFYRKFGFIISAYPEPQDSYYGKIELNL